jgi:beta-glucosidase
MQQRGFPDDFLWGTATASFQVEGGGRDDGRGESIWDRFCRTPGKVRQGDNGEVSTDQYHRYAEDIELMRAAGIGAYRFSIAWPRILPAGVGAVNQAGLDYYRRLVDSLLAAGIEPVVTLYHWDLPQALQDAGGWTARSTAEAFAAYADICFRAFAGKVKRWITLNEPYCAAYLGHLNGYHAPGVADRPSAYRAVHHLNLAHGLAVRAFRSGGYPGEIGIVWNLSTPRPATRRPEDRLAVERLMMHETRMFTDPVLGRGYPQAVVDHFRIDLPVEPGDLALISATMDFVGVNYYAEHAVAGDAADPSVIKSVPSAERVTQMGWAVVPEGLVRQLRWIHAEAPALPIYICENGCAEIDEPTVEADGVRRVHDPARVEYLRAHLAAAERAIAEGLPLKGYFVWSFIDNFEWAWGYSKRFGIVYCDYQTLERVPKDSYYFYRDVIAGYVPLNP